MRQQQHTRFAWKPPSKRSKGTHWFLSSAELHALLDDLHTYYNLFSIFCPQPFSQKGGEKRKKVRIFLGFTTFMVGRRLGKTVKTVKEVSL